MVRFKEMPTKLLMVALGAFILGHASHHAFFSFTNDPLMLADLGLVANDKESPAVLPAPLSTEREAQLEADAARHVDTVQLLRQTELKHGQEREARDVAEAKVKELEQELQRAREQSGADASTEVTSSQTMVLPTADELVDCMVIGCAPAVPGRA